MRVPASHLAAAGLTTATLLALAACGSSSSSGSSVSTPPGTTATTLSATSAGPASTVALVADPGGALRFTATTISATAGTVTVRMRNPSTSGHPHGIAVEGNGVDQDGKTVQPGGTSIDTLTLTPGRYSFYCPVPGHEASGMKGTLIVT